MREALHVLVIGDSVPYHGPESRLSLADPRMYQNVMAREVEAQTDRSVELVLVCRAGMTTRDAWQIVTKDPSLQELVLPGTDIIVYQAGGSDALPIGLPTWLKDSIPYIPHSRLRSLARNAYWRYHKHAVRITRGRFRMVPRAVSLDLWSRTVDLLRFYSGGAPVVAATIQPSNGEHHGYFDPHSARLNEDVAELAEAKGVPCVDVHPICLQNLDRFNEDGMHWDYETHTRIGLALAELVVAEAARGKQAPWAELLLDPERDGRHADTL